MTKKDKRITIPDGMFVMGDHIHIPLSCSWPLNYNYSNYTSSGREFEPYEQSGPYLQGNNPMIGDPLKGT